MSALYLLLVCALSSVVVIADQSRFVPFGIAEGDRSCNTTYCLGMQFEYNIAGVTLPSFDAWSLGATIYESSRLVYAIIPVGLPGFALGTIYSGPRNDSALLGRLSGLISNTFHGVRAYVVTWDHMVYGSDIATFQMVMIVDASGDTWSFFYYGPVSSDSYIAIIDGSTTWYVNDPPVPVNASDIEDLLVHVSSNPPTFAPLSVPAPVAQCGDGQVNGAEQCDGGDCCNADCSLKMDANCFCGRQSFVGGEWAQNYFCSSGQANKYYQCLQGPWSAMSRLMDCPLGTSCGCGNGQECSCGGLASPCVMEGTQQTC